MSFFTAEPPTAADFEAALRYIFGAWASLPEPAGSPPDDADMALHLAFTKWCEARRRAGGRP
jgi:hypothetical protein